MNIYNVLESLQKEVTQSRALPWPLQEKSVVDRKRLLGILNTTRDSLPEEVKQARWVSRDQERLQAETGERSSRLMREAEARCREMIRAAEDEAERILSREELVLRAREESQLILDEARQQARRLREQALQESEETRREADRYALKVLSGMEGELVRILTIIQKSQAALGAEG